MLKDTPLVSVIVPNYCHARFLDERIEGILGQTYQHFELIILDDCSPDEEASKFVIEKYRANPHVSHIIYNEKNSGSTFRQWHKGIELAKGEIIWIAESDDTCKRTLLERLVYGMVNHPNVVVSYATSELIGEDGMRVSPYLMGETKKEFYLGKEFIKSYMSRGNGIPNASSAIFLKSCALKLNQEYLKYHSAGDRLFWIEICKQGNVYHVKEVLNGFRQHGNNVTKNSMRSGRTSEEDYLINRYLERSRLISLRSAIGARLMHINEIKHSYYDNPSLKKYLLNLWSCHGLINYTLFSTVQKTMKRLHL